MISKCTKNEDVELIFLCLKMAFAKYAKIVSLGTTIVGGGSYIAYLHNEQNRITANGVAELTQARNAIARIQSDMDSLRLENALLSEKYTTTKNELDEYTKKDSYNSGLAIMGIGGISLMCAAAINSLGRLQ
jgi:hypothetical protein